MAFLAFDNSRGESRVLDGRNRLAACELAGVEPKFETFDGDDKAAGDFAFDTNFYRREMSKGAKAIVFAMRHPEAEKGGRGKTAKNPSKNEEFSTGALSMARLVLRVTPTVAIAVRDGLKPLNAAYDEAKVIESERAEFTRKLERLKASAQDLALEMMRRAEEAETGEKTSKQKMSSQADVDANHLSHAAAVLDYSIDSDLVCADYFRSLSRTLTRATSNSSTSTPPLFAPSTRRRQ